MHSFDDTEFGWGGVSKAYVKIPNSVKNSKFVQGGKEAGRGLKKLARSKVTGAAAIGAGGYAAGREHEKSRNRIGKADVSKIGDWKTIDQRELSQRRARKTMRRSASAVVTGTGIAASSAVYGGIPQAKNIVRATRSAGKLGDAAKKSAKFKHKARSAGASASRNLMGAGVLAGGGLAGAGVAAGSSAKGVHTYHQHKINDRRRKNKKKKVTKAFDTNTKPAMAGAKPGALKPRPAANMTKPAGAATPGKPMASSSSGTGVAAIGMKRRQQRVAGQFGKSDTSAFGVNHDD